MLADEVPFRPSYTLISATDPPVPVTTEAVPVPARSAAATNTPAVYGAGRARKLDSTDPSTPLNTFTFAPPPGPAPVMRSGVPSPLTSPAATVTPPAKDGS